MRTGPCLPYPVVSDRGVCPPPPDADPLEVDPPPSGGRPHPWRQTPPCEQNDTQV